jgi:alpha-2-macroglobulin
MGMENHKLKNLKYILIILVLFLPGCKDHKETVPDELSEILGLKIDRPLEVALASPQGATSGPSDYQSITVVFNQPMKALSAESASITEPFKIDPAVSGKFRWKGSATVSFEPKEPLKFGTTYKIEVPAGLKSPGGNELKQAFAFEFTTPGPTLVTSIPKDGSKGHKVGDPLFLQFDQPIDASKVQSVLSYTSPEKAPKPQVAAVTDDQLKTLNESRSDDEQLQADHLVAVATEKLEPGTWYTLKVDKGLVGNDGPLGSTEEHLTTFRTLGPLEWTGTSQKKASPPEYSVPFEFNNKVNSKNLKEHISISPTVAVEVQDYDEDDDWNRHSYYLALEPNTTYTFTVGKELTDIHGQKLGKDITFQWKTSDRRPLVNVPEGIAVLEAEDTLTIPMGLRNVDRITYRMIRLDRNQVAELLADEDREWLWGKNSDWKGPAFSVKKSEVPTQPRNQVYTYKLDIKEALKNRKFGFVYYQIELKVGNETRERRGLVQVTNLGATAKFSPENSLFMATSLDQAKPLAKVEATVLDPKGRPVWRGTSNDKGVVEAPGWSKLVPVETKGDSYYSPRLYVFLKHGEDEAWVENDGFGGIDTWQFDVPFRWSNSSHYLRSKVYSERGLYKPGEKVHLKGSLRDRENGHWTIPQVSELNFEVYDSRDQKFSEGKVELNQFGTFNQTVQLQEKAPTGTYRVSYKIAPDLAKKWDVGEELSGAWFRVEEFEPAQFEVDVTSPDKALVMGGTAEFQVQAKWLFGAPMMGSDVEWTARIEPAKYSSEEHPGYEFGPTFDPDDDTDDTKTLKKDKGITDDKGILAQKVEIAGVPYQGDADLVFEGTITSANRRSITGSTSVPVARGEYRIGLKPQSRFLPAKSPVSVSLITLSPEGEAVGGKDLKVELIRREWNSVKKSDVDGRFRWVTEVEDKVVQTETATSAKEAETTEVSPAESGYYIVRVTGTDSKENTILSESSFYAHGGGYVPWGRSEGDAVELVTDKPRYAPGDTATILIKNPFEGEVTALVTYERDLILHSYTTTLNGSAPVIEVPLTKEHLPNLYVSVMLFRGRIQPPTEDDTEDIGKPTFKVGYVDLPVSPESKRLKVSIQTDQERYGPGDEVVTKLTVTDQEGQPVRAELSLTAADVGVLNLINFKTPDLFDTYYSSLPLAVRTAENRLDVIGQRSYGTKGEDEGGGGGYGSSIRKDFKSTAVWEPNVVTDKNGKAEVKFNLPQNLTTFRVMATAISMDTDCGSAEHEIINTKPLVFKPSIPAFARVGDEFKAGVLAVNGTTEGATLKVRLESEGITSSDPTEREVFLKAGEEREILFTFKAEEVGTPVLKIFGTMKDDEDAIELTVPIQLATQKVNLAHTGTLDEGDLNQKIEIPKTALEPTAELKVDLSSSILLGLDSSVISLLDYPYGCLEQRLSRLVPLLLADDLLTRLDLNGWNQEKVKVKVQESLDKIPGYADSSGGLKVWPDSKLVHPYLTARALKAAYLAKKKGYEIKGKWVDNARAYLKRYLQGETASTYEFSPNEELVVKAAALDALTCFGYSGKGDLNKLMDQRAKMPVAGKAYLLHVAYRIDEKKSADTLAQEMMNSVKIENATAYFEVDTATMPWIFSSDVHDTGLVLEALMSTERDFPVADKVVTWLLEARTSGTWGTTANNAAALGALVAYSKTMEGEDPSFTVNVKLDGKELGEESFSAKAARSTMTAPLKPGTQPDAKLSKDGDGRLYYTISVGYEDTEPSPAKDEGLTVLRSVVDLDGKPVGDFVGGKIYKVKLSVIAPALRRYVVLRDPVPAGLSVVKTDFATESSALAELLNRGSQPSWQTFHRFEDYSDRVLLFADALAPGEHTYEYLVRAQTPGTYLHPAAQAEEMYHPELFGRTPVRTIVVK